MIYYMQEGRHRKPALLYMKEYRQSAGRKNTPARIMAGRKEKPRSGQEDR